MNKEHKEEKERRWSLEGREVLAEVVHPDATVTLAAVVLHDAQRGEDVDLLAVERKAKDAKAPSWVSMTAERWAEILPALRQAVYHGRDGSGSDPSGIDEQRQPGGGEA